MGPRWQTSLHLDPQSASELTHSDVPWQFPLSSVQSLSPVRHSEGVETKTDFIFGGFKITADGDRSHEIGRLLLLGRKVMTNLDSTLKSRDITLPTKACLVKLWFFQFSSVQFSRSVMSDSLQPHESQHTRPPCPSPAPGVYSNSCPLSQWCHPTISSSVTPFSSCPQSLPASGSFPMSQLFA